VNFTGNLNLNLRAIADMYAAAPSYTFAAPVLGGRATLSGDVPLFVEILEAVAAV
jgi:hypothetical protein